MSDLLNPPHRVTGHASASAATDFRRLVVYEVPSMDVLLPRLAELAPGVRFVAQEDWSLQPCDLGVPVWHWSEGIAAFAQEAGSVLREFVFPMLAEGRPCCFAFDFPREELQPRPLDSSTLAVLDLEDIGRLFALDVVEERFSLLPELAGRITLTPIERMLQQALQGAGIDAKAQAKFGRYRLDFLVERTGRKIAIEADGRDFHDAERDTRRDEELEAAGIEKVLRFTGSEIWLDADGCAARVKSYIGSGAPTRARFRRQSLDTSQLEAVEHGGGAARVLAPAGAGKTRVLVNRIAELIERGVEPSSILALAFNKKANEQLVDRLKNELHLPVSATKLFAPESDGVVCATFNAFGYRYQRELLSLNHDLKTSAKVWRELMERAVRESGASLKGAKRGADPIREFLRALECVRADLADPEDLLVEFDTFTEGPRVIPFAPTYAAYQRLRIDAGIQAFGDQLHVAVVDLLLSPRNREFVQSRFRHVLVDEYQDLNAAQLALVDIVSRPWRNLFVVGDDDQLIYGWLFAELTNILGFHDRVPARPYSATYVLSTNYRSSRAIVETSRRVIDHNEEREWKQIQPSADAAEGEVRYVRSPSWQERANQMVRFLNEQKTPRSSYRDLAVLCRYKAQQPLVALALDRAGIPRTPLLTYRLFSDRQMQLLRSYLELVRDPIDIDGPALALILNRPNRYLKNELVETLAAANQPWQRLSDELAHPACPASLKDLADRVMKLHDQCEQSPPSSMRLLQDVLLAFGLEGYWRDAHPSQTLRNQDDADATHLLSLIRLHADELADPTEFLDFWDDRAQDEDAQFGTAADDLEREVNPKADQVVIGTIHSSKGREYDAVVLYDYDADLSQLEAAQIEEERRVFYVGLTRARLSALITIDGSTESLPQFVRESIMAGMPQEEATIEVLLRELRDAEADLVVGGVRLERDLLAIASGAELERCRLSRDQIAAALRHLKDELDELAPLVQEPPVWARLRRHAAKARRRATVIEHDLEEKRAAHNELDDRTVLLETKPDLVAAPIEEELRRAQDALGAVRARQRTGAGRQVQLQLLGPQG